MTFTGEFDDAFLKDDGCTPDDLDIMVGERAGVEPPCGWTAKVVPEVLAHMMLSAPCRREEWLSWRDLPAGVLAVLVAALARLRLNPQGYRSQTIGEYSHTFAGTVGGSLFTPDEVRIISSAAGCGSLSSGAYTVRMVPSAPAWSEEPL